MLIKNMKATTPIRQRFEAHQLYGFAIDKDTTWETLDKFGISASKKALKSAMDAFPEMFTTASVATPIQFLQFLKQEVVTQLTTKKDIDELVGVTVAGTWADEEIVQAIIELLGQARPYGDKANPNLASYNVNYEKRTIVRFEEALETGILEEERASKARLNSRGTKKEAVAEVLEIARNLVGYNGYVDGDNKTYGFLNDPNLPAYISVASGAGASTLWQNKTYLEITKDIITAVSAVQVKSGNNFNPLTDESVLAVSVASFQYLNTRNALGTQSVLQWIKETYPKMEVKASAFLDGANGGANVFYLYAKKLGGKPVIEQNIQDKMRFLGLFNGGKKVVEYYSNATAGVMLLQPAGVVRYTGI